MSAFVVSNIAADLKMQTNDQRFIFGNNALPEPLASFKIDNIFTSVVGTPSITNFETRNKDLSGFRWIHTTNAGDTFGSYKLQSFINAQSTGTDILLFNQDGTIVFTSPVTLPGFAVSGDFNMNSYKITNLADPINDQDAATKAFVESIVSGGTITLSGAISASGNVGTDIVTTLNTVPINKLADYPADATLFLRGDSTWSNNFAKIGVNTDPTDTGVIQFANGSSDAKIILNKDTPSNSYDLSGIGYYPTFGTLYHTPLGKSHAFFMGTTGNMALEMTPYSLKLGYSLINDFRKIILFETADNSNQTYAIGVEIDGQPTNYNHLRTQVATINDAFNWCYGIDANTSDEWMRLDNSGLNLYNKKIFNVPDPQNPQEVATKNYVDNAIDSSFGPVVSLPYDELNFNWAYASSTNPSPYQFTNTLTDSQESKDFKYRIVSGSREWNQEYTLIGNSDLNGIYKINYNAFSSNFTPLSISIYPFATSQNRMNIAVPIDMGSFEIMNAANPTTAQSLATKNYVDNLASNLPATVNVTGITQTFNYSNTLTSSIFSLLNTNVSSVTRFKAGTSIDYIETGYDGGSGHSYINLASSSNDRLAFRVNGTGIAAFLATGLFGFGTITPTLAKVQINGGVQNITNEETALRAISSTNSVKIELQNTSVGGKLYEIRSGSGGTFDITDRTSDTTRFVITGTGNIGIGMGLNSPNAPLQLANVVTNRQIVLYEAANNNFQFHGFGSIAGGLGYNINATTDSHVFFAGVNSTSRNEVARVSGTGTAQFRKIAGYTGTKPNINNAGSLGTGATFTINGSSSELSGTITIFSGTGGNTAGPLVGISLLNVMPNSSWGVILFPGNNNAANVSNSIFAVVANNFQFTINGRTALTNNTTYIWNYHIIGA